MEEVFMTADESGAPINSKAEKAADKARSKAMRPWYKKKRFIIPAAFVLIGVVSSATGGGGSTSTDSSSATTKTETTGSTITEPGIGTQVSDGKFTFVVNSVKCGVASVGSADFGSKAQGQFCIVDVSVSNTGTESQMMDTSSMYLYDAENRKFSTTTAAMFYMENNDLWLTDINPGNSIDGKLVFDLPVGATPISMELHDSMFSGGVTVQLTA
jgi:hypothetical protein